MAVPFSNTKLRVPRGFQNLLEGLAREVLRNQPEDIYTFGAKYFEELMKIREEEGIDPVEHGAKLEDRFYNNKAFKKPDIDSSDPQQQDAAVKIQTKYRQHAATQEVQEKREEQAAVMIQSGYRGFQGRQRVLQMKDPEEYEKQKEARDARKKNKAGGAPTSQDKTEEEEEIDIDLNDPEVEKAATKIQAGFKGMKARKQVSDIKRSTPEVQESAPPAPAQEEEEEIDIDLNDPEVEKAATKIQAGFKGMKARKDVQAIKETQGAAASKIQAGFRGMRDRKRVKAMKSGDEQSAAEEAPKGAAEEASKGTEEAQAKTEEEEEIDIDLNDPEVEKAATKIQAGFKGFKARKEVEAKKSEGGKAPEAAPPAETEAPPAEEKKEEEEEIDIDLDDPEVEKAATKIQAGFKGLKARKEVAAMKKDSPADAPEGEGQVEAEVEKPAEGDKKAEEEEEVDIDLNDPEVGKAATKIQAGFRGMQARKEVATKKAPDTSEGGEQAGEEQAAAEGEQQTAAAEEQQPAADQQPAAEEQQPAAAEDQQPAAAEDQQPAAAEEQAPTEDQQPAAAEQTPAAEGSA